MMRSGWLFGLSVGLSLGALQLDSALLATVIILVGHGPWPERSDLAVCQ
ncbi:MAG: hypothetical protein HLUCCX14_00575 [Marinobacter excellens HL-55]|uniref:Uncharacterized protein n=1 Tax=Marinobacter excellens HL-55 TaxID=1305731 RepID=A0A0P7YLW0_9GAMM|nr:MAG: hypothetical protein HLUCCX14_00575 [Marinobacter excellens HL-55]